MSEKDYGPGKKATYTYEEVRPMFVSAMKDRAKTLGCFYKVMPKDEFEKYAKKALTLYGAAKKDMLKGEMGDPKTFAEFLVGCNSVANTCDDRNAIVSCTPDEAVISFTGKCALVAGWEEMGLSPEEVDYLCQIQSFGDFGHSDAANLDGHFACTSAQPGCDHCEFVVKRRK